MRWKKDKLKNICGEERIIKKFLFFPKCLKYECRWLEKANILQKVVKVDIGGSMQYGKYKHRWKNIRFTLNDPHTRT